MPRRGRDARAEIGIDFLDAVLAREIAVEVQGRGRLRVKIPPGANDGTRVRLAGQGEAGSHGAPAGDLVVTLRVGSHPFFRREGDDLHLDVPVTIPELVLGAKIDVPTPEGSASVSVPPASRGGARLRLRGKGATTRTGTRGDLILHLEATLPESAGERLDAIAKSMEPLYEGADVRAKLRGAAMTAYTLRQIAEILGLDPEFLEQLAREEILLPDAEVEAGYSERMLERARVAHELVHELEVNLAGASVIVRLREEMVVLRQHVHILAREVERTRGRD